MKKLLNFEAVVYILILIEVACGENKGGFGATQSSQDLYNKFRIVQGTFRVAKCSKEAYKACIQWGIASRQNNQDSVRVLNVTTTNRNESQEVFNEVKISMSDQICNRHSTIPQAKCNYTIPLQECQNYMMRLGSDANIGGITTVPIKPRSLKVELLGINSSHTELAVQLDIECNIDFVSYIDYDVYDKFDQRRKILDSIKNASCEDKTCYAKLRLAKPGNRLDFCRQYSFQVLDVDIINFNTPPEISGIQLLKFEDNKAFLTWSISPPDCKLNPLPLIEKIEPASLGSRRRVVKVQDQQHYPNCSKGSCYFQFELESCTSNVIYPNRMKSKSITVLRPSIFNISAELDQITEDKILLSWTTGCQHDQKVFTGVLTEMRTTNKTRFELSPICRGQQCESALKIHLLPCAQYEIQFDGSTEIVTFYSSLNGLNGMHVNASAMFTNRSSLSVTVIFSEIDGNCANYLTNARVRILSNPPIEGSLKCEAPNYQPSFVKCIGAVIPQRQTPPCVPSLPSEISPTFFFLRNGEKVLNQTLQIHTSLYITTSEELKIEMMAENLTVNANNEKIVIEWDSLGCQSSENTINFNFVPKDFTSTGEKITVPAKCFKQLTNSTHSILMRNGSNRLVCPNNAAEEKEINLLPCTTYSLSLNIDGTTGGGGKEVQFTSFLNDKAKLRSITSARLLSSIKEMEVNISLLGLAETCAQKIKALEIRIPSLVDTEDIFKNLSCESSDTKRSSITCFGTISVYGLDICESHPIELRTLFGTSLASQWHLQDNQTLQALQDRRNDDDPFVKVHMNTSIAADIEWSDSVCLLLNTEFWEIEIANATHVQHLRIPRSQLQAITQNSTRHQYKIATNDARLSVTLSNKLAPNSEGVNFRGFDLTPCARYTVKLTPAAEDRQLLISAERVAHFSTGLGNAITVSLSNLTSDSVDMLVSYPKHCLDYGLVQRSAIANVDGQIIQASPGNAAELCANDVCSARWKASGLKPCTEYKVNAGDNTINFLSAPDRSDGSPQNLNHTITGENRLDFFWDSPTCTKQKVTSLAFKLWTANGTVSSEVLDPASLSFVFYPTPGSSVGCFTYSYQIGAVWFDNFTLWSEEKHFNLCTSNGSTSTRQIPSLEHIKTGPPNLQQPMGYELGSGHLMSLVLLFVKIALAYLFVSSLVVLLLFLKRRKRAARKRKTSEVPIWLTELEPPQ